MIYPNLEAEMTRHGIKQEDFARMLGKRPETISSWMNGKSGDFPVRAAMRIKEEKFPNCEVEYLFAQEPVEA